MYCCVLSFLCFCFVFSGARKKPAATALPCGVSVERRASVHDMAAGIECKGGVPYVPWEARADKLPPCIRKKDSVFASRCFMRGGLTRPFYTALKRLMTPPPAHNRRCDSLLLSQYHRDPLKTGVVHCGLVILLCSAVACQDIRPFEI